MKKTLLLLLLVINLSAIAQVTSADGTFNAFSTNNLVLQTNGVARLTILNSNGSVGIGNSPSESLDAFGTLRLRSIPQNNSLTRLLVSDGTGKVFWRDVSSLTGTPSTLPHQVSGTNIGVGFSALVTTTASNNSAFGYESQPSTTTGSANTSAGYQSQFSNTTGYFNSAFGNQSLYSNTEGFYNVALGPFTLYKNTESYNTAVGAFAAYNNSTGTANTALGVLSLYSNTTGYGNTTSGYVSLRHNTTGYYNSAFGQFALYNNSMGTYNTASGAGSLQDNSSGSNNVANGASALGRNGHGSNNTSVGTSALLANIYGNDNTALGYRAGPSTGMTGLSNTTAIGSNATITASNQVRIGNSSVTSIGGQVSWSTLSDGRFKQDVKEDVSGLDFINALRPVSYTVDIAAVDRFLGIPDSVSKNQALGRSKTTSKRQTGFVAQEVEKAVQKTGFVFYGIDVPQSESDHYSLRYSEFVVPLTKAVQELSAQVNEQQKTIERLTARLMDIGKETRDIKKEEIILHQNVPNPFSSSTEINMFLPENITTAKLMLYTLDGRQLKSMDIRSKGDVTVSLAANELDAGMYLYALLVDNVLIDTKRMILTK